MGITKEQLVVGLKEILQDWVAIVTEKDDELEIYFPGGKTFALTVKEV
ncbi:MAG: hypothetical protein IKA20_00920 [Clostridia bacterium]|nr:hypothetical protein [Clostridia bacterium]